MTQQRSFAPPDSRGGCPHVSVTPPASLLPVQTNHCIRMKPNLRVERGVLAAVGGATACISGPERSTKRFMCWPSMAAKSCRAAPISSPRLATGPLPDSVVDVSGISEIKGITVESEPHPHRRAHHLEPDHCRSPAPMLRRAEKRGPRNWRNPDTESRHRRRQSLQRVTRCRQRATTAGSRR